ncbi:MAG: DNA repair exonuclease [Nitrospinota bacterium]|nr:DNA repair exonuclease [Nitrospinota bacterium]
MTAFRFIHCSDLHIDSPFKGFSAIRPDWADRLREAPLRSFLKIVDLAISEQVDAVLISGDVFDGEDKSLQAQFKFRRGLQTLSEHGIPTFIAHGNHDPLNTWSTTLDWPEKVNVFPGSRVSSIPVKKDGRTLAHIYGTSFHQRDVFDNLALQFNRQQEAGFAVAVLHANVGGHPDHDPYAPCAMDDLVTRGMDYWALGHIHAREVMRRSNPAIVYCGNSQGRFFKESGPKGCYLVTLKEGADPDIQFMATDTIRFMEVTLDLSSCVTPDDVVAEMIGQCQMLMEQAEGRSLVVRQTLTGRTEVHPLLHKGGTLNSLRDEVLQNFPNRRAGLWLEFRLHTRGTYDIDTLTQGQDFIADLIALYGRQAEPESLPQCREALKPLFQSWEGGHLLPEFSDEELREILLQARNLTLDELVSGD